MYKVYFIHNGTEYSHIFDNYTEAINSYNDLKDNTIFVPILEPLK